jgi:hypothetical protein
MVLSGIRRKKPLIQITPSSSIKARYFQTQNRLNEPQEKVYVPKKVDMGLPRNHFSS